MAGGTSEAELNEGTIEVGKIDEHGAFALEIFAYDRPVEGSIVGYHYAGPAEANVFVRSCDRRCAYAEFRSEGEATALFGLALDGDLAAVELDQTFRDGEAQA